MAGTETKRRKKKAADIFRYINPKELAKEVHIYGYDFSWKIHIKILLGSFIAISMIAWVFKLKIAYFFLVLGMLLIVLPVLIIDSYKRMYEQKRFADVSVYAEQMLYSFQKSGKVGVALKETKELFEDGQMHRTIEAAISYVETGISKTEEGTLREALALIEEQYFCREIHMVHELLLECEEFGGDVNSSISMLLEDIETWKRRCYSLQANKKICHADNVISIVVSTLLCVVALWVLDAMGVMFSASVYRSIFLDEIIQISSFMFILFLIGVFEKSMKSMSSNWLQEENIYDKKYLLDSYELVMARRGTKMKTGLGYRMARKDVSEAFYVLLPQWMREMALLLQHNNVQVSIAKSLENAPTLLQAELRLLQERLKNHPGKLSSYTDFCKDFDIPEAQSVMKMLHAMAESGTGDMRVQMHNLIDRVQRIQNIADEISGKQILFRVKIIFLYPVLAATVKLMVDLSIAMFHMLEILGNMGGM